MGKCTRCGSEAQTVVIYTARPGGHVLFSGTEPDFSQAPPMEQPCGECITDSEIRQILGPAVAFVLGVLTKDIESQPGPYQGEFLKSLDIVRAPFMIRSNDDGRRAALRAIGLAD